MIERLVNSISGSLTRLEGRLGLAGTSALISFYLLTIAVLYVQPVFAVGFHGIPFSDLSKDPFDFTAENPLRYRILAPLLGYLFFLRGEYFFILPMIITALFPAIVYYRYRKSSYDPADAFILTCFIVFSCVILLPLVAPGYTDVLTWLLIFLAFSPGGKLITRAVFFALAILNHESSLVMAPALILYHFHKSGGMIKVIIAFLIACIPHFAYRYYVNIHTIPLYNASFYLSESNVLFTMRKLILYLPAAAFYAFKLWWILPVCFMGWAFSHKNFMQGSIILSILAGAFLLVVIGYDYTRMLVIAFPAVMLAYAWFLEKTDQKNLRKISLLIVILNFIILQYHFNYDGAQPMFPWILNKVSEIFGTPLI